ncbi:hypothetical protein KQX54_021412 [Cotesia glomerata]|uniref:Uncharacterized protein n=1 Tax=Cotesia glomerata TaxID=32391 RepID=A0AAV7JA55_COTGL|nr:hypothetical protein KQX54_021412 [Cotesia glomerata]
MPVQRIELKRKSIAYETIMNGCISTDAVRRDDNARQHYLGVSVANSASAKGLLINFRRSHPPFSLNFGWPCNTRVYRAICPYGDGDGDAQPLTLSILDSLSAYFVPHYPYHRPKIKQKLQVNQSRDPYPAQKYKLSRIYALEVCKPIPVQR